MKLNLAKEITWIAMDKSKYGKMKAESPYEVAVKFDDLKISINIQYDNPAYTDHLQEKFNLEMPIPGTPTIQFITGSMEQMKNVVGSHIGYLSEDERINPLAFVYASDFGVVKSVVNGFASFLASKQNYHPAHAAVVSLDGVGTLLIGASGAGKTSTLLKIMNNFQNTQSRAACLTDDWCIVKKQNNKYFAQTFDPSISFSRKIVDEFSKKGISIENKVLNDLGDRKKVSLLIQDLYGLDGYDNNVNISKAIVLNPEPGEEKLHRLSPENFSRWVVESAYHYPYINKSQKCSSKAFWASFAENHSTYLFNTRSLISSKTQKIDVLIDILS